MRIGQPKFAASFIAALLLSAPAATAAPLKLSGSIAGYVRDTVGVPQMGATVLLFNSSDRLIKRVITNDRGLFGFESLAPDIYSVRVSLASFMPIMRQKIAVKPGLQSLLYVDLAGVLSSIELVYAAPGQGALMSDDWKWTLRGSIATRSVLRLLPDFGAPDPAVKASAHSSAFSDTVGLLNVSGGDPGSLGGPSSETDLGTAFALATSFLGSNQIQLSGNLGYSSRAGVPAAGLRTSYRRDGENREVALTVQQMYLPIRPQGPAVSGPADGSPALRTISLSMHDSIQLDDNIRLDYGTSLDSVTYLDRLNNMSEFARLSYDLGNAGTVELAFSSGAPPTQLMTSGSTQGDEVSRNVIAMAEDLAALSILPRLSMLDGRMALQRSQNFEIGYEKKLKRTTLNATTFRETVSNAAITVAGHDGVFAAGDVLPDVSSNSSILDAGSFHRTGFAASATQALGDHLQIGVSFGRTGALALNQTGVSNADELRAGLRSTERFWASAHASTTLAVTHTQIMASYQWTDYSTLMPSHFYLTQTLYPEAGLNIRVRQPLPAFPGMPGHLEATAELRNGLAQGYLPVSVGGERAVLVESPRAVRGGLSFIF